MADIRLFRAAQRLVCALPESVGRGAFNVLGTLVGLSGIKGVRQLRLNLGRVVHEAAALEVPALEAAARKDDAHDTKYSPQAPAVQPASVALTCKAMRSYMRYYYEALRLPVMTSEHIRRRVRLVNADALREEFANGHAAMGALMHAGNWDMAGAWAELELTHVHTLAEKLEPEELYDFFVSFRSALGMDVYPAGHGAIHALEKAARNEACLIPLLADRDLTVSGIEVPFFNRKMMVAVGPALLAQRTGYKIFPIFSHYERLHGEEHRAAGCAWGTVLTIGEAISAHTNPRSSAEERREDLIRMSKLWIAQCEPWIREHPEDWHMLQKVFVEDLDPERLARARARAAAAVHDEVPDDKLHNLRNQEEDA